MTQMPTGAIPRWAFIVLIWIKNCCGLTDTRSKERKGAQGPYTTELTPEKEAAICATLIHFDLRKNE